MKIGIDARFYGPIGKGLGRYTQEVVDNLIKINGANGSDGFEYVIFLSPDNFDDFNTIDVRVRKVKLSCIWYGWKEQFLVPYHIWREKLDLVHFHHFNVPILTPGRFVVTIHDLILTRFPTVRASTRSRWYYYFKNIAYRLVIWRALRRSSKIIAVSQFTKNDLVQQFGVAPAKIVVTYEGLTNLSKERDSLFVTQLKTEEVLAQYQIPRRFLLYVGNAYPHKNLEFLLKVFSRLHAEQPDLRLVLVGKLDYFYLRLQEFARSLNLWQQDNHNSPVIFTGYVPDAQLAIFYAAAIAYIFPSLYEGFGLPPLEAMAQGCPVLSSDRSSLPEILGEACWYFNPEQEQDLHYKLIQIMVDPVARDHLQQQGYLLVKKYNWWECANQTRLVYREALQLN
jgi:glycosyltransferase involved in cell wall biosynthesis